MRGSDEVRQQTSNLLHLQIINYAAQRTPRARKKEETVTEPLDFTLN